eukprot:2619282-Rhodomonas_salina.1
MVLQVDRGYGRAVVSCYRYWSLSAYALPMLCPILTKPIVLRTPYAMWHAVCGTEVGYGGMRCVVKSG